MKNEFFQEQREQSIIKARIVSKYFSAWANIMLAIQKKYPKHDQRMAYVDLFAGPGRYDDQSKSTPLLVLETILSNPDLSNRVITLFNDKDLANINSLKTTIANIQGIEKLNHAPIYFNEEVGDEIARMFSEMNLIPTFFFVDPWGYKGLSLNLVSSIIKDWGCDCVLFFNYNRVNMGINNNIVEKHMVSLFGVERLKDLRNKLCDSCTPDEREIIVVQELCDALKQNGSRFVLPFRFKTEKGERTSHHLIFLSKNFLAYDKMKEIMAKESSDAKDGVANFEYNPRDKRFKQGTLLELLSMPLDALQSSILEQYAGQTINFLDLYEEHSVDRPYIKKNYKEVLRLMYDNRLISAINPVTNTPPRKGSFPDSMRITFGGVI